MSVETQPHQTDGPLDPQDHVALATANERARKVRKAAGVAAFNGWGTAVLAVCSVPFAPFSIVGFLVMVGLAIVAYNELRGRKRLLQFDPDAAKLLGWNQLGFLGLIIAYCAWMLFTGLTSESPLAAEATYRAGRTYRTLGLHTEALAALSAVPPGEFAERALFHTAEIQRAASNGAAALAAYQKALATYPKGELATQMTLGLAHCQRNAGAHADAIESYAKVVAMTDTIDAAHALIGCGQARMAMKQYKAATKDFLKVDILYGYDELKPQALIHLVSCYQALGDQQRAAKYKQELQTRYPE
jgi:tetratricopeptide (TPR) repeat protein